MKIGKDRLKVRSLLPWIVCLLLFLALAIVLVKQRSGEVGVFESVIREEELLSDMRLNLFRAAEAEKSAVLAVTDEASRKFADQARLAAAGVDRARQELAPLIDRDHVVKETSLFNEFTQCWGEFLKLDRTLLDLAVQNTNLHATQLALTRGTQALNRLEVNLTGLADSHSPDGGDGRVIRLSCQALVAAFKIHDLYTPHIEAETDVEMNRIEKEIKDYEETLKHSLAELARKVKGQRLDSVKRAEAASAELAEVTDQIIVLSRRNTNIKSLELSLGKKRLITAQCDEVLNTLLEVIRGRGTKGSR